MKSAELNFITVGKILTPWELHGKVKIEILTDFPERFEPGSKVYINQQPRTIKSVEWTRKAAIIKIDSIDSVESAEKLRGRDIEIRYDQLNPLPEGQYYQFQLIGMEVRTAQGEIIGKLSEILPSASCDIYVVRTNGEEVLLPATDEIVKSVDLDDGVIVIEPIPGLLELNKKAPR